MTCALIAADKVVMEMTVPGPIGALVVAVYAAQESSMVVMLGKTTQTILRRIDGNRWAAFRLNPVRGGTNSDLLTPICER